MKKDIYLITNLITGTKYVGQSSDANKRFLAHKRATDGTLLHQAIRNYGFDNFYMEILETQIEDFNEKEQFWIQKLNTLYPNGYNMTKGGEGYPHMNGELCYQAALTQAQVDNIIELLQTTALSQTDIGAKFNVSQEIVSNINLGKTYFNILKSYPIRSNQEDLQKIEWVKTQLKNSEELDINYLVQQTGFTKDRIYSINLGKTYKEENTSYPLCKVRKNKLDDKIILQKIKDMLLMPNLTTIQIAQYFNVQREAIEDINAGRSYFNESWEYPIRNFQADPKGLDIEQLHEVEKMLMSTKLSFREIARRMNIGSHSTISAINNGKIKRYYNKKLKYPLRQYN